MATVPITITGDAAGNITVAPTAAICHQGDLVQWNAPGGTSLTLSFKKGTPFDVAVIQSGAGTAAAERNVQQGAANGRYPYSLTATINGTNYIIPGCPEIVIQ